MRYIVFLSLIIFLISCNQTEKTSKEKTGKNEAENEKQTIAPKDGGITISTTDSYKNALLIALQNKDSVRLSQKAKMDSLLEDSGQRYAMQNAMEKFKRGVKFYEEQDLPAALEQFKLALANIPENSKVNHYLGRIYYEMGQKELSLSYYKDAVKYNIDDSTSILGIGQVYFDLGDHQNAMEYYNITLDVAPNYGLAYYNRGTLLGMQNNYIEALEDLNKSIELDPDNGNAYINRGLAYFYLKQLNSACRDWQKAADMGVEKADAALDEYCR